MVNSVVESICLAMPGPFDYDAGICLMRGQAKYESLYGLNVKEMLAASLHTCPDKIFIDNDAACFLQGEVFGGAAIEYEGQTVVGVTLGTGLGSAVYKEGKSYNADLWQLPFKDGIAEDYVSTRWFLRRWQEVSGPPVKGVKEVAQLAAKNEKGRAVFSEFGDNLGQALLRFIQQEEPAVIIVGGNIANAFEWFGASLQKTIAARHPHVEIKQAALGEEAPLLGAVGGWLHQRTKALHIHP